MYRSEAVSIGRSAKVSSVDVDKLRPQIVALSVPFGSWWQGPEEKGGTCH